MDEQEIDRKAELIVDLFDAAANHWISPSPTTRENLKTRLIALVTDIVESES